MILQSYLICRNSDRILSLFRQTIIQRLPHEEGHQILPALLLTESSPSVGSLIHRVGER